MIHSWDTIINFYDFHIKVGFEDIIKNLIYSISILILSEITYIYFILNKESNILYIFFLIQ